MVFSYSFLNNIDFLLFGRIFSSFDLFLLWKVFHHTATFGAHMDCGGKNMMFSI